jgi:murein DD-endopeptidase MepM/ murein hydrolase activator NlpD
LNIYAAASGKVVFTGLLVVRGNTTIVDHGWGIYTCYYHQSQILVKVGDQVQQGQLIGQIGATGRVTGPHLHFEVWVNGIQVSPIAWLSNVYP